MIPNTAYVVIMPSIHSVFARRISSKKPYLIISQGICLPSFIICRNGLVASKYRSAEGRWDKTYDCNRTLTDGQATQCKKTRYLLLSSSLAASCIPRRLSLTLYATEQCERLAGPTRQVFPAPTATIGLCRHHGCREYFLASHGRSAPRRSEDL